MPMNGMNLGSPTPLHIKKKKKKLRFFVFKWDMGSCFCFTIHVTFFSLLQLLQAMDVHLKIMEDREDKSHFKAAIRDILETYYKQSCDIDFFLNS